MTRIQWAIVEYLKPFLALVRGLCQRSFDGREPAVRSGPGSANVAHSVLEATAWDVSLALDLRFDVLSFGLEGDQLDDPIGFQTEQKGIMLVEIALARYLALCLLKSRPYRLLSRYSRVKAL